MSAEEKTRAFREWERSFLRDNKPSEAFRKSPTVSKALKEAFLAGVSYTEKNKCRCEGEDFFVCASCIKSG